MNTPNINVNDIVDQANDTLESITAVKGEKYADTVRSALSASSVTFVLSAAMAGQVPREIGNGVLLAFITQYVQMVCEKNGTPWDDELEGWVTRIKENTDNMARLLAESGKPLA